MSIYINVKQYSKYQVHLYSINESNFILVNLPPYDNYSIAMLE